MDLLGLIHSVQKRIWRIRLKRAVTYAVATLSYLALGGVCLAFFSVPLACTILGILVPLLVFFAFQRRSYFHISTLDAADYIDKKFSLKNRVASFYSLHGEQISREDREKQEFIKAQILDELGHADLSRLTPPVFLEKHKKFLYSLPIVFLLLLFLIPFYISSRSVSFTNTDAQKIAELIHAEDLPEQLKERLEELAQEIEEHDLSDEEVLEALEAAEEALEQAEAELEQSSDSAGEEYEQPEELSQKADQAVATPTPTPTLTPAPSPRSTPTPQPSKESQSQKAENAKGDKKDSQEGKEKDSKTANKEGSKGKQADGQGKGQGEDQGGSGEGQEQGEQKGAGKDGAQGESEQNGEEGAQGTSNTSKEGKELGKEQGQKQGKEQGKEQSKTQGKEQESKKGDSAQEGIQKAQQAINQIKEKIDQEAGQKKDQKQDSKQGAEGKESSPQDAQGKKDQQGGSKEMGDAPKSDENAPTDPKRGGKESQQDSANQKSRREGKDSKSQPQPRSDQENVSASSLPQKGERSPSRKGEKGTGKGLGADKAFQEQQIGGQNEKFDTRYTDTSGKRAHRTKEAVSKTELADVELARPEPIKNQGDQPIPLEYRDLLK